MSFIRTATLAAAFVGLASLAIAQAPSGASPANPSSTTIPSHPCSAGPTAMGDTDVDSNITAPLADQTGQPKGMKGNTGSSASAAKAGGTDPTVGSHAISGAPPSKMTQSVPSGAAC